MHTARTPIELSRRAEILLKTLVECYISGGQPVGSRTLAREAGLELSSATVRNVMADLEAMGLIRAPHTSAGRVPTPLGYRVFVDFLVKVKPLDKVALRRIEERLADAEDPDRLLEAASTLLSQVTRLAGLVTVPKREQVALKQLEFLALSRCRILVILVTEDGRVQNRVIATERRYTPSELVEAANCFNATYAGTPLREVRRALLNELERDSERMHRITQAAVEMARRVFAEEEEASDDLVVAGESNLFDIPDWSEVRKLRSLIDAFKTKQDLLHLLDQSMKAEGVQIFIGEESGYQALRDCSVVTAPYEVDGRVVGTLGVIGPTRMPYEHVIPTVDVTAKLLSAALQSG